MSGGPDLQTIIQGVVRRRFAGVDPDDMDTTWEVAVYLEGEVFDYVWDNLPKGYSRNLVEQVLGLVDWQRVAERATWDATDPEEEL